MAKDSVFFFFFFFFFYLGKTGGSDWCGSVGGAPSHKAKVLLLDSQSGHMPGLWALSIVGYFARGSR